MNCQIHYQPVSNHPLYKILVYIHDNFYRHDSVTIFEDQNSNNDFSGPLCGNTEPSTLQSPGNFAGIQFVSDYTSTETGKSL